MRVWEIPDRKALLRACTRLSRKAQTLGIIFIDLDGFKLVNDIKGHSAGDRCLEKVGLILNGFADSRTSVFRYGGDEFVALVANCTAKRLNVLAESMRKAIESGRPAGRFRVTASIGVVLGTTRRSFRHMLDMADWAAYVSKCNGKNRVTVCPIPPDLLKKARERRIEENFTARNRRLLLRARELSEAARQICFHVELLYGAWSGLAELDIARETLLSPSTELWVKSSILRGVDMFNLNAPEQDPERNRIEGQLAAYRDSCRKAGIKTAAWYMNRCLRNVVAKKDLDRDLHLLVKEIRLFLRSRNPGSQRLRRLSEGYRALFDSMRLLAQWDLYASHRMVRGDFFDFVFVAMDISTEVSALTAELIPEMRATVPTLTRTVPTLTRSPRPTHPERMDITASPLRFRARQGSTDRVLSLKEPRFRWIRRFSVGSKRNLRLSDVSPIRQQNTSQKRGPE